MRNIVIIAHNIRSCHNVGSLLRTADGLGVKKVILSGYTPYPLQINDDRLPHLANKISRSINKTALGSETSVPWQHSSDIKKTINSLKRNGYQVWALEQAPEATQLPGFTPPDRCALIIGREVEGIEPEVLTTADGIVEIPMFGQKESFNVAVAAAIALYHCRFTTPADS